MSTPLVAVLIAGVPEPRASTWATALRAAGHAVLLVDAVPEGLRGDVVVVDGQVDPETSADGIVALATDAQAPARVSLSTGDVDLVREVFEPTRGEDVPLTTHEAALLRRLAREPGRAVARDTLLREVWGYRVAVVTRSVDNTVGRLRTKIEVDPAQPVHLVTDRGLGYRLEGAVVTSQAARPAVALQAPAPPPEPLVGRESAIAAILARMDAAAPLVTITGPPGVGKSAVARAIAARRSVVQVARPGDVGLVVPPADGTWLLVDDADDDALAVARALPRLRARGVRILATSREPLGVDDETCVRLLPLSTADAEALLVARTGRGGWATVAASLDGLPVAVELAAEKARLLSPDAIAARMARPLAFLAGPTRRPERHRSLLDAVAWSWARLGADEREACAWCGARGSFSLLEAEAGLPHGGDALRRLVHRSLVERRTGGFVMLPLIAACVHELNE